MFHYMNEKEVTFNVKYEIVLYTPVFNAPWPRPADFHPCSARPAPWPKSSASLLLTISHFQFDCKSDEEDCKTFPFCARTDLGHYPPPIIWWTIFIPQMYLFHVHAICFPKVFSLVPPLRPHQKSEKVSRRLCCYWNICQKSQKFFVDFETLEKFRKRAVGSTPFENFSEIRRICYV